MQLRPPRPVSAFLQNPLSRDCQSRGELDTDTERRGASYGKWRVNDVPTRHMHAPFADTRDLAEVQKRQRIDRRR
ncbi:hypothetical protein EVAR_92182_1 [Eumeta japonica]|uniref:Uncharacterized protein n=1 Tax=Eumeta variegata TaxID=151549 RepID=A0A4C2A785_EUMVA|nr:hypothetical protein EVAR_92182_1 [Eumeta japonica]